MVVLGVKVLNTTIEKVHLFLASVFHVGFLT